MARLRPSFSYLREVTRPGARLARNLPSRHHDDRVRRGDGWQRRHSRSIARATCSRSPMSFRPPRIRRSRPSEARASIWNTDRRSYSAACPMWAVSLIERSIIVLIPLLTLVSAARARPAPRDRLAYPLARVSLVPGAACHRARRCQADGQRHGHAGRAPAPARPMERRVLNTSMPLSRSALLYTLRQHLELVRARLGHRSPPA